MDNYKITGQFFVNSKWELVTTYDFNNSAVFDE